MTKKVFAVVIALLYSIAYVLVGPITEDQSFTMSAKQILPFVLCFVLCTLVNYFAFTFIPRIRIDIGNKGIFQRLEKLGERKLFLIVWGFIFVSWIPAYLVLYPGVLSYDMMSQVSSAMGEITNNHHPILHTWLIRVFMKLGKAACNSYEFGIGLLSLLQMVLLSYALARLVLLLKKKVSWLIAIITAVFSALWFMNACLSVTMIKDTLHAAFLVLFACHFAEIATTPSEYLSRKRNLVFLPLISFFMCAFRNNGYHIYLFCFLALALLRIAHIKKVKLYIPLIVAILVPVLAFKIYTGPVFHALDIEQGEVREALSIPIQQLQRVAINKAGELTEEQTELMLYYITDLSWRAWDPGRKYDPFISDPAKSCFSSANYNNDVMAFWKFYLQTGKQFTKEYIRAFLSNTLGFWYPGYYEYSNVMYENYPSDWFVVPLERKSILDVPFVKNYYESVCSSEFWRKTPVLRIFVIPGFALWLLLYGLALAWRKRGYFTKVLPVFLPLIAQFGIMILSPMSSFRYSWPFYLLLPLVFVGIFGEFGDMESPTRKDKSAKAQLEEKK